MPNRQRYDGDASRQEHADAAALRSQATDAQSLRASDEAHRDMVRADKTARSGNPFSLTNVILSVSLIFGGFVSEQLYGIIRDDQKTTQTMATEMHDTLLTHGYKLDALQIDVTSLKADVAMLRVNCMTQERVDGRIRELAPHSSVGINEGGGTPHWRPDP